MDQDFPTTERELLIRMYENNGVLEWEAKPGESQDRFVALCLVALGKDLVEGVVSADWTAVHIQLTAHGLLAATER